MWTLVAQIIVSLTLILFIVLQAKGTGLSGVLGGSTNYHSKRGIEKSLFYGTLVLSFVFVGLAMINAI